MSELKEEWWGHDLETSEIEIKVDEVGNIETV